MTNEQLVVTALLAVTFFLLITGRVNYSAVALIIVSVLTVSGILAPKETLGQLANPTIMLYVGSFVISEGFRKVGLTKMLGDRLVCIGRRFSGHQEAVLFFLCASTAVLSIFLQALGVQIVMMVLILTLADELGLSRKKALFALGFSATIGGTFTLLGNNVDLLAKSTYETVVPDGSFGMFEMSPFTIPAGLILLIFWSFVGSRRMKEDAAIPTEKDREELEDETLPQKIGREQVTLLCLMGLFLTGVILDGKILIPANVTAIIVLLAIGAAGIMSMEEMVKAINWNVVLFAVGIMTLSASIVNVKIADLLAEFLEMRLGAQLSLRGAVAILFIATSLMTQLMSNAGSFGVMAPIAITLAAGVGLPVKPLIIAVCIGANSAYATPMATPSYAMLQKAGNITFGEFVTQGLVLLVLNAVMAIIFIPVIWG